MPKVWAEEWLPLLQRDLAEWAISAGTRFVYASSAATYGDGQAGMDDGDPRSIQRLQPLNLYAQSKQQMDLKNFVRARVLAENAAALAAQLVK